MVYANFRRVMCGLDVSTARAELARNADLWAHFTARQSYPGSAHRDTECIVLRGTPMDSTVNVFEELASVPWPALDVLEQCGALAARLAMQVEATDIGRVMVVRLKPGGHVDPHTDEGAYAKRFSRFHIPIASGEGDAFTCGGETLTMLPGTAWWFNHRARHHVHNGTPNWRVHLIVDLASPAYEVQQ